MQPEESVYTPSSAVLDAQKRLLKLRDSLGIAPQSGREPLARAASDPDLSWELRNATKALQQLRLQHGIAMQCPVKLPEPNGRRVGGVKASSDPLPSADNKNPATTVTIHPTMVLAILRQKLEAPARVYFLLRAIDGEGRGWLTIEHIRQQLTGKGAPLRICGWRRLRQLLRQGDGIFWDRDSQDQLWLRGAHKIAYKLDLGRLQGFPVELPISALLGGIQAVRAAFYATFHSGRDSKPISRETLRDLSGIAERTQLEYDRVARVERRCNLAVGEGYTTENAQERAWHHGRAAFHFIDTKGLQGRAGREYVAWHLPNSYRADYRRRSKGSRKRLNRKLADLLNQGITGNDERGVERCFFANGALAARQYNRDPERDAYWRKEQSTGAHDGVRPRYDLWPSHELWGVIAGMRR
jgi:hypothetical protein